MRPKLVLLAGVIVCCLWVPAAPDVSAAQGYEHFIVGNPADVVTPTDRLAVLHGGGTDIDDIFVRMGAAAGGGDFVVLRASGTDAYNPYI
jgi:cyanophycinase